MNVERIKEVLENLKEGLEFYKEKSHNKTLIEWQETLIWAIEKQVPKKPKVIISFAPFSNGEWRCPNCNTLYCEEDDYYEYCEECGQHLDWSDDK